MAKRTKRTSSSERRMPNPRTLALILVDGLGRLFTLSILEESE